MVCVSALWVKALGSFPPSFSALIRGSSIDLTSCGEAELPGDILVGMWIIPCSAEFLGGTRDYEAVAVDVKAC